MNGRPIYIPARKHRMFNKYVNAGWKLSKSCRLRNVKKNKRGVPTHRANRLLSHRAYPHVLPRLSMLCEENRVQIAEVEPGGTSKACARCGSRGDMVPWGKPLAIQVGKWQLLCYYSYEPVYSQFPGGCVHSCTYPDLREA